MNNSLRQILKLNPLKSLISDIESSKETGNSIINKKKKDKNIYNIINKLDNNDKIFYVGIIVLSILFFSRFNVTLNTFFGIIISFIIFYFMINNKNEDSDNFMDNMTFKINALNKITHKKNNYLYTDIDIVDIFTNIIDLRKFSASDFDDAVYNSNLFLKIKYQLELGAKPCTENIELLIQKSTQCLNKLKNLFHNLKNMEPLELKLNIAINALHTLFDNEIKILVKDCNKDNKKNINYSTRLLQNHDVPKPDDLKTEKLVHNYKLFT